MEISEASSKQDHIKQILRALNSQADSLISEYQEENKFNEARVFELSEILRDFNTAASEVYPGV